MHKADETTRTNPDYWNNRYESRQTGWDLGEASPPIYQYFQQVEKKDIAILIPGCGFGYETEVLLAMGFKNITLIDVAELPVANLRDKYRNNPDIKIIQGNFFEHEGHYNVIIEQTFFCAIEPALRADYVEKCHNLLAEKGRIIGLLFDRQFDGGPPYGGHANEYKGLFGKYFEIKKMEPCYNSVGPRAGNELFVILIRKPIYEHLNFV